MLLKSNYYFNRLAALLNVFSLLVSISILTSCEYVKVGKTVITPLKDKREITIDNFPNPTYGVTGLNTASYPSDFSFEKVDLSIYNLIRNKGIQSLIEKDWPTDYINIKIRHVYRDKYGKDSSGIWLNIGSISVAESQKYETFTDWNREYSVFKMLKKQEIDTTIQDTNNVKPTVNEPLQTQEKLDDEENLIDFTYGKGTLIFHNTKSVPIQNLILAYYVNDSRWSGWMTAGTWTIQPGEKFKFPVPLNPDGNLGTTMYYNCMYEGNDGLFYEIGGNEKFVISSSPSWVIFNANLSIALKKDKTNFEFNRFKHLEFKGKFKNFTIGIGPNPDAALE